MTDLNAALGQIGITGIAGGYYAHDNQWHVTACGAVLTGFGKGPTFIEAAHAAILDMRQQVARAIGGGAEVVL